MITPQLEWSPRKTQMMIHDLRMMLSREGAPNTEIRVEHVGVPMEEPTPPAELVLSCSRCEENWRSALFTSCPKCGKRDAVEKVEEDSASSAPSSASPARASTGRGTKRTASAKRAG